MKIGKESIYNQPAGGFGAVSAYARQLQREAHEHGEALPPPRPLQMGEPNFLTPTHIRKAAIEALEREVIPYGPPPGWPWFRELLAEKIRRVNGYHVGIENVVATMGGTNALQSIFHATVGPGDEVLIPDPCWPVYYTQLLVCGATAVPYRLDPANEWLPSVAELEQLVTPRTRMLLINTPGNPTGAVFPRELIADLLAFALRHDLYLLSDECYDQIVFEGEHVSPATLLSAEELEQGHFIGVYTFSKTYAMTGWRVGYAVASKALIKSITEVLAGSHTNVSLIGQRAAAAALTGPQDCVTTMREAYRRRRDLATRLLKEYDRYIYTPHGAFYALIDVRDRAGRVSRRDNHFALDLLREYNVMIAPGNSFGATSAEFVRISLAASDEDVEYGVRAICEFADK
ncbi:pyridoxal phosphate-dependent aminotransferase [Ktedonobacter robiniae]|uniref:Aspartate aminotransferase n=1 Tax=Ktedonobacter robiniae TaxID=2778365 RepID=A0ABQ3UKJ2_9CHLR|nr:aminotransferase class I/II-fold pyridoxal phosphate-dependent enzyme [Ktedonobacter robiniae]GHO53198.1 aspartate aminotransferase [Ktedonobacter robiniae]